jgi:hypothetical protein
MQLYEVFTNRFYRVRAMWISQRKATFVRVGTKGKAPKDDGYRQDAVPQTRLEAIQEWFQVRQKPLWNLICREF